ncbi:MAG: bifunctional diaminohydroxyphosphoribosylaminopyrimidine deaminase/5-amino-6-(5-phosphoribosylamino)uracil reductase RibD, partial [Deltaproteobacteria bacterium]
KYHEEGLPLVTLKWAQSLDGRIATLGGDSWWISSDRALRFAHRLRAIHDAVLVGIGTVLRDDPQLTVRLVKGRDPLKVVLDSELRIPPSAKLLRDPTRVILASTKRADPERVEEMKRRGVEVLLLGQEKVDLKGLLKELHKKGVQSVLVEGGGGILTSFLKEGLADRVMAILSPKIIGKGIEAVGDLGIRTVGEALRFQRVSFRKVGQDLVFEGWLRG